jgi:hypothetical protein
VSIDEKFRPHMKVFPATELPPYSEPVLPSEMQVGRVYFALQYLDRDLLVPHLYPLIFLGDDLDGNPRNMRFFQDFDSYSAGVRYASRGQEHSECFQTYGPDEGKHIFDYDHALNCSRDAPWTDETLLRSISTFVTRQKNPVTLIHVPSGFPSREYFV